MSDLVNFTSSQLQAVWTMVSSTWVLSSVVIIGVLNLVATVVIRTMGNNK